MAKLMRATESYYAGNDFVREGDVLAEGDPRLVELYVEPFTVPEPATEPELATEPKAKTGKAKQ